MHSWKDFFYTRTDTDDEIRIVYRAYPILMWIIYALTAVMMYGFLYRLLWARWLAGVVIIASLIVGFVYAPCERILREGAEVGKGYAEGRKLSMKKPYTITVQLQKRTLVSSHGESDKDGASS